ncbi:MAG: ABC transporter permease [Lacrimispora sp.]|uniref:ABC transporter permease n=1 Tax=Lacrimispora sp. TaxID=2719234 RepID=UPI0039E598E7
MLKYIGKRILISIPTFLGITILVYVLSSLAPGTPLEMIFNDPNATAEQMEQMRQRLGLDQPVIIQYLKWFLELLQGNMGISYRTGHPVWADIGERIGPTLLLTFSSLTFSVLIAIPLGIMSAYKPYTAWDYISSALSFIGAAIPNFFAGLVFVYLFSVLVKAFPSGGMYDTSGSRSVGMLLHHLFLPMLVLSLQQVGSLIRQTRGAMLDVLQEDYIRTARSKGVKENRILIGHGLQNAFIPVVTRIGMMIPFLVGGAVVTEQIFAWPGLGSLMVLSITSRDYPTIMGITVFIAAAVLIGNIIVDLIYGLLDPKIRYS